MAAVDLFSSKDQQVEIAGSILRKAEALRQEVSRGRYTDDELEAFWKLAAETSDVLHVSKRELSEAAGLGATFFSKSGNYPRYANLLRGLTGVMQVAREHLPEGSDQNDIGRGADWISNPREHRPQAVEDALAAAERLIAMLAQSNSLSEVLELDRLWREQLIAHLETVVAMLRAPLVERSMLRRTGTLLKSGSMKLADYSAAGFIGGAMAILAERLASLL